MRLERGRKWKIITIIITLHLRTYLYFTFQKKMQTEIHLKINYIFLPFSFFSIMIFLISKYNFKISVFSHFWFKIHFFIFYRILHKIKKSNLKFSVTCNSLLFGKMVWWFPQMQKLLNFLKFFHLIDVTHRLFSFYFLIILHLLFFNIIIILIILLNKFI